MKASTMSDIMLASGTLLFHWFLISQTGKETNHIFLSVFFFFTKMLCIQYLQ